MHSLEEFNLKSDLLMERFRSLADGKTVVTLFNEINRAALDIIASVSLFDFLFIYIYYQRWCITCAFLKVGFGMNTDSINDPKNDLNHNIYEGVKGFYRITFEPFLKVFLLNFVLEIKA